MESKESVLYEVRDAIARITLNRPEKRNALNAEIIEALKVALRRANHDQGVCAVILIGAGSDFCSGADLQTLQKISSASVSDNLEDVRSLMEVFSLIRQLHVPVIAAVRGRALAGGCGLALACDLVLAERSARFGFPEVKIGFVPAMVMAILRRNVSEKKAFELIALGEEIAAADAATLGLINHAFEDANLEPQVQVLAQRLAKLSTSALSLSNGFLYKTDSLSVTGAMESGMDVNVIARMSEDSKKGIARFLKQE